MVKVLFKGFCRNCEHSTKKYYKKEDYIKLVYCNELKEKTKLDGTCSEFKKRCL